MFKVNNVSYFTTRYLRDLKDIDKTLNEAIPHMKGDWFISDGTLLGFIREGDFIGHDTDLDVAVYAPHDQKHIEIPHLRLIRTSEYNGRPTQTAYIDENDVIFDIYYYYDDIIPGKWTTVSEFGKLPIDKYKLIPLKTKYGEYPHPEKAEEYLQSRYGAWKTPSNSKGNHC